MDLLTIVNRLLSLVQSHTRLHLLVQATAAATTAAIELRTRDEYNDGHRHSRLWSSCRPTDGLLINRTSTA